MTSALKSLFGDHSDPDKALAALFSGSDAGSTAEAVAWGRSVLAEQGIAAGDQVKAVRALRAAEPRLPLKPATRLAALLAS